MESRSLFYFFFRGRRLTEGNGLFDDSLKGVSESWEICVYGEDLKS